jgi:hypothetical protein
MRRWLALLVWACLVPAAGATMLVPMPDESLVALSDLVVVGRVERIESVLLGADRVHTRVALAVESALKGDPGGPSIVVTEPGGDVAGVQVVVFGSPEWAVGERALAFLTTRGDGSLTTTALALGKYTVDARARARRARPVVDERPLGPFAARVRALAAGGGRRGDGRAGVGVEPALRARETAAFTLQRNLVGVAARWFEADCARDVVFERAGMDDAFDEAASAAAVAGAAAAWSGVPGGGITLAPGPAAAAVPTIVGGVVDGRNTVVFGDPFDEAPAFVDCRGVVAVGGFRSQSLDRLPETRRRVSGETFIKIVEGDVVINPGVGACLGDPRGLAEVVTHEIGHAIGFGHSSEADPEPDPTKADATMYFRIHNDGRGAALRSDDVTAGLYAYPGGLRATTPVDQAACEIGLGLLNADCVGEERRLASAPFKRIARAARVARKAARAISPAARQRLLAKALRALARTEAAVDRSVFGACADGMRENVQRARERVHAALATR